MPTRIQLLCAWSGPAAVVVATIGFMIQNIAIGTAILRDQQGLLPRWVGYVNYWVAFLFVPDVLAFFFHSGPFAWRGIFVFWLAFVAYATYLIVMGWALRQAVIAESDRPASKTVAAQT